MKWSSEELAKDPSRWIREQREAERQLGDVWGRHEEQHATRRELQANLTQLFKNPKTRNQLLKRLALVEYRCQRGCFLGAVFAREGEQFVCQRQNVRVTNAAVELHPETLEPRGVEPGTRLYESVAREVHELLAAGWTRAQIGQEWGAPLVGVDEAKRFGGKDAPFIHVAPWEEFEGLVQMNCEHQQAVLSVQQVVADIRSLGNQGKKVIQVPRPE